MLIAPLPTWIDLAKLDFQQKKKKRFKEMWLANKGCGEVVEGVWQSNVGGAENTQVLRTRESWKGTNKMEQELFWQHS